MAEAMRTTAAYRVVVGLETARFPDDIDSVKRAMRMRLWQLALFDLLFIGVYVVVLGVPLAALGVAGIALATTTGGGLGAGAVLVLWALGPFTVVPAWAVASLAVLRRLGGVLQPGAYPLSSPTGMRWSFHFLLHKVAGNPALKWFLFGGYASRWALLRALGARLPLQVQASSDAWVMDCGLVQLGEGSLLGARVLLCAHGIEHGKLRLGPIVIGDDTQILEGTLIGPDVQIGAQSTLQPEVKVGYGVKIGSNVRVGAQVVMQGPGIVVGDNAVIGRGAELGPGVVVEAGARVPAGAQVRRGSRVAADATTEDSSAAS
jgi:acetyltransferase-like isoleucine patch superfamily enzyme